MNYLNNRAYDNLCGYLYAENTQTITLKIQHFRLNYD